MYTFKCILLTWGFLIRPFILISGSYKSHELLYVVVFINFIGSLSFSHAQNMTVLRYRSGILTWILVGVICFFTLECGLCCLGLIPFCLDAAKDIEHVHPVTGQVVGVYKRI